MVAEIPVSKNVNSAIQIWQLGVGLIICLNCIIIMGLKFRWFRARVNFGESSNNTRENITGVGFKSVQTSEFSTYTSVSEFSTSIPNNQNYLRPKHQNPAAKRETNPEVALKVRSMLNRSLSNAEIVDIIPEKSKSTQNISTINYENEGPKNEIIVPKRKVAPQPKSILKRVDIVPPENTSEIENTEPEIELSNGFKNSAENLRSNIDIPKDEVLRSENKFEKKFSDIDLPPPINFETMPKIDIKSLSKEWDTRYSTDNRQQDYIEYDEINHNLENPDYDTPYVIEIQEGTPKKEDEYAIVNKKRKQKKSISFDDEISTINDEDDNELYSDIIETLQEREKQRISDSSDMSSYDGNPNSEDENEDKTTDMYGNDYTNTKRTSYFQAGNSTYSTQAASIFFGNKKPVAERRPTKRFEKFEPEDSDGQTSA